MAVAALECIHARRVGHERKFRNTRATFCAGPVAVVGFALTAIKTTTTVFTARRARAAEAVAALERVERIRARLERKFRDFLAALGALPRSLHHRARGVGAIIVVGHVVRVIIHLKMIDLYRRITARREGEPFCRRFVYHAQNTTVFGKNVKGTYLCGSDAEQCGSNAEFV